MTDPKFIIIVLVCIMFYTYCWIITKTFGGPLKSISESYYRLRKIGDAPWFIVFISGVALGIGVIAGHVVTWIAAGLLGLVALSPAFKDERTKSDGVDKLETQIHVFGATGSILLGFTYLVFWLHQWYIWIPMFIILVLTVPKKAPVSKFLGDGIQNYTWWIEVASFTLLMIGFSIDILI